MPSLLGKEVGSIGYGTMSAILPQPPQLADIMLTMKLGMTWNAQPPSLEVCFETLNTTLELGANFWNGGELYGTPEYNSLHLLNKYFTKYPENAEKVVLSVKGGLKKGELVPDGSEENIRRSVDECLRLLDGTKKLDIFECARQDSAFPVENTIKVLAEYVKEGKIGGIGLSEVDAETIRRAHKVHPIATVEVEMSLWSTDILQNDVAKTCAELDIPVIAYSPLGRGVLTGAVTSLADIPHDDIRHHMSRFQEDNFKHNLKLINEVNELATRKGVAPAQIALAWIRTQSGKPGMPTIIPIPGGTTKDKVVQNMGGAQALTDSEMAEIDAILEEHTVSGPRY